jgi:NADH-quinone oxidoreductase subunit E
VSVRRLYEIQPEQGFAFNAENLAWAKQTIAKYPAGKQASAVIPLLWRAQEQNDNWVSKPVIEYIGEMLDMSYIRVLEVATFYTMFQLQPVGKVAHIQVCGTTPCMLRGAEDLKKVCQNRIHHEPHHLSADGRFSWEEVECLGACVNAPMVQIFKDTYEDLTPASLEQLIDDLDAGKKVKVGPQINRHHAAPEGGPTTLIDPELYRGQRSFTRVEPPPPPPPADAPAAAAPAAAAAVAPAPKPAPSAAPAPTVAAAPKTEPAITAPAAVVSPPGTPSPAQVKPQPEDIRPVTAAAKAADAQRESSERKEIASTAPGSPMEGKAQRETNVSRASAQRVEKAGAVASVADAVSPAPPAAAEPTKPEAEIAGAGKSPEPMTLAGTRTPAAKKAKPEDEGKPELLKKPKGGRGDDLKLIWGVGPKLEKMLNDMGIWHFDQIASWTAKELSWVDERLEGFKGRAKRDEWVKQSKKLATGWRPENEAGDRPGKKK